MGDKHTPTLTASGDRIYGETPEDGIMVRVYGDPELAEKIACAVNRDHLFGELVTFLKPLADHADYLEQHFDLAKHPDAVDPETHLALPDDLSLADCQRIRTLLAKVKDEGHG